MKKEITDYEDPNYGLKDDISNCGCIAGIVIGFMIAGAAISIMIYRTFFEG